MFFWSSTWEYEEYEEVTDKVGFSLEKTEYGSAYWLYFICMNKSDSPPPNKIQQSENEI